MTGRERAQICSSVAVPCWCVTILQRLFMRGKIKSKQRVPDQKGGRRTPLTTSPESAFRQHSKISYQHSILIFDISPDPG
jgi:hypothetical protein